MNLEWVGGRGREPYNLWLEGTEGLRENHGLGAPGLTRLPPTLGALRGKSHKDRSSANPGTTHKIFYDHKQGLNGKVRNTVGGQNPAPPSQHWVARPRAPFLILGAENTQKEKKLNGRNPAPPLQPIKATLNMGSGGSFYTLV